MKRRITLRTLYLMEDQQNRPLVRELEMAVDGCLVDTAYAIQFWRDVELYGIREAYLYLEQQPTNKTLVEVQQLVDAIQSM